MRLKKATTLAHTDEVGEVHHGGTVQGQVTFSDSPPAPLRFPVEKNPEICGQERNLLKIETYNGFLAGAVVVLEGFKQVKILPGARVFCQFTRRREVSISGWKFSWSSG
jgi:hypothetical protein